MCSSERATAGHPAMERSTRSPPETLVVSMSLASPSGSSSALNRVEISKLSRCSLGSPFSAVANLDVGETLATFVGRVGCFSSATTWA